MRASEADPDHSRVVLVSACLVLRAWKRDARRKLLAFLVGCSRVPLPRNAAERVLEWHRAQFAEVDRLWGRSK